jgi:hypothetical protein
MRSLGLHLGLSAASVIAALSVWTKEEETPIQASAEIQVWGGNVDQLEQIRYESRDKRVRIEPKKDEQGRYFVVNVDRENAEPPPKNPHAPPDKVPEQRSKHEKLKFIAVKEAGDLAEKVAPLMALRAIGRIDKKRAEEFGFDKPDGKVFIKLAGKEREFVVGSTTPGGGDRYVRLAGSNEAYAIPGDIVQGLSLAESRLLERQLHGFEESEVKRVRISKGAKAREVVRMEGKAEGWASASTPKQQDETSGNWLSKVSRLRISKYVEKGPKNVSAEDAVVRIDYFDDRRNIGYLELLSRPGEKDARQYLVKSEYTRWYAEVLASTAEQVEQDLDSVLDAAGPK